MRAARVPLVSALVSCAFVILAAVLVRGLGNEAFETYCSRGGEKGFWSWFARDLCGVPVPGVGAEADEPAVKAKAAAATSLRRRAELSREIARLEELERRKLEEIAAAMIADRRIARKQERKAQSARHVKSGKKRGKGSSGGFVKTGGKSSYVAGDGKYPYRVTGIRGIEFGTTENAPAEGVRPVMSVSYDADGNMKFNSLRWRENKDLTEPVYGFDKAYLSHTFETEQLSSVTFNKSFPFTEEGLQQAVDFYKAMSAEASADLGFDVIDVDKTANNKSATVCEFRNGDGDTSIRGAINAWSDKSLTVTFSVSDNAYSKDLKSQARTAYDSGLANEIDARIEVAREDYTERKERISGFLEK